ncbi:hypothetical protein [uncultured Desulfobulbus sp.]|uniref:hypothetical protein n=1 Tax=uncultured Desulfobulbus sp. TaxID=239745 RepID=UPI0029C7491F|nr:hypothetical protein [uncultured Desulfobulbus sp.]
MWRAEFNNKMLNGLALTVSLLLVAAPDRTLAVGPGGGVVKQPMAIYAIESKYYGIIESRPDTLQGEWVIRGRTFRTEAKTKFDQSEGPLRVGSCAKVRIRNDHVREISNGPWHYCQ